MLISIVIPTFRRPDMLATILPIIIPQILHVSCEIIVVDNCPDGSAKNTVAEHSKSTQRLSYIHQPKPGVVHARNAGIDAATGAYVLFLDDDEIPCENWLAAFEKHAKKDITLAFGKIYPRYETTPNPENERMLDRIFSRDFTLPDSSEITAQHAHLGTGNAMFHKGRCFPDQNPFNERFNRIGGEDVWLIKGIIENGEIPIWVPDALVDEFVPKNRTTLRYIKDRRFNQGRLRCLMHFNKGGWKGYMNVIIWMTVGAIQASAYSLQYCLARILKSSQRSYYAVQIYGGLGKLLWWKSHKINFYGGAVE